MKPLAFAADAEGYKYIAWVFNGRFAISSPKPRQIASFRRTQVSTVLILSAHCCPRRRNLDPRNKAVLRTRASVRRASGFVQIAIALIIPAHGRRNSARLR